MAYKMKRCGKCKVYKPLSAFGKSSRSKDGLRCYCKECRKEYNRIHRTEKTRYNKKYWQTNKIKLAEYSKEYRQTEHGKLMCRRRDLKKSFGITLEQYDKMVEEHDGVCAICGDKNINEHRLCVDHDHETDRIRGLLCDHCNHLLGCAKDSIIILRSAINYLYDYRS